MGYLQGLAPSDLGLDVIGDEFRPKQLDLAERILESDKRIICLIGPTGLGKSLIVRIPGIVLDQRTLILTRTIQLQDQYGEQGLPVLMGRNRYICNRWEEVTAAQAVCRMGVKCGLRWTGECDYYNEKDKAANANTAVLNYAVFFRFINSSDTFTGWDWVVLDEAHSAAAELTSAFTFSLVIKELLLFKLTPPLVNNMHHWRMWALNNRDKVKRLISKKDKISRQQIEPLFRILGAIEILIMVDNLDEWLVARTKDGVMITPIWPTALARAGVWMHGHKFILSSATLEPYMISNMLGIEPDEMEIVSVGSDFPIENRPINVLGHHKVSHTSSDEDISGLVKDFDKVVAKYPDQRGLVHTGNYSLAAKIAELSVHKDRLLYHDAQNRLTIFEQFKNTEGSVLLSPAMVEGVDLPYDLCRFQIVAKVPYQDLTSDLWRARLESDIIRARLAYTGDAINAVVQACGRGMRAADDKCDTWILDRAFDRIRAESNYRFPPFFTEAVRYIDAI